MQRACFVPFCPDSLSPCQLDDVSNAPPTECMELAVEPRLSPNLSLELGLSRISLQLIPVSKANATYLGKGYSFRGGDSGESPSTDSREASEGAGESERMAASLYTTYGLGQVLRNSSPPSPSREGDMGHSIVRRRGRNMTGNKGWILSNMATTASREQSSRSLANQSMLSGYHC